MNSFAALARLIENLVRFGTIAEVDEPKARVRVKSGELLTTWLPWLALRAGADRQWNPPTEGEQVVLLSPSGLLAQGIALTGLFSEANPANGDRAGLHRTTYRDGAVIEYDSVAHLLTATIPGAANLSCSADITISSAANITINAEGNLVLKGARVDIN
ncbi:phage baseplate assembly protein V [Pseudomonas sp. G34]|uniref:phage baseplate assembly protein V n=1 Tax=Pseudomonas sp. G34 TaxID=3059083 RepID=UPI00280987EA|nr:phage baseplate assembly protein V [Pseudomonas sp. G34]MDQ7987287.1 phage baseplate assembly protein V [Pseudomonas sp. G34]